MAFTPLHDRVLVERVESEAKTAGGLIIPDSAKEKPAEGMIVAVGEGARKDSGELIPMSVKEGDKIFAAAKGNPEGADGLAEFPDSQLDAVVESAEECPGECIYIEP